MEVNNARAAEMATVFMAFDWMIATGVDSASELWVGSFEVLLKVLASGGWVDSYRGSDRFI